SGILSGTLPPDKAVMLDLAGLELTPAADDGFQLEGQLSFEDSVRLTGRLEVIADPDLTRASIRFPSGEAVPWLDVLFDQKTLESKTTTRIEAVLNADAANRDWLDSALARSTGRAVTRLDGKFSIKAEFSGQSLQGIKRLMLTSENLHLLSDNAMLKLDADLLANRQNENIDVELSAPVKIEYQGDTGWIDELLGKAVPGLQLQAHSTSKVVSEIAANTTVSISTGSVPSASLTGDINLALESAADQLKLKSTGLQIEMADLGKPELTTVEGVIALDWAANAPIAYTADGLNLTADKMNFTAKVTSRDGKLNSTGSGVLMQAGSTSPVVSTEKMDLTWQGLDLEKLTGKLSTRTQGFRTVLDGQTWTGFDLDMTYALLEKNGIKGSGKLTVDNGPELPLEFAGNTQTMRWDIKLAPATVRLAKLKSLLSLAHVTLPAEIKLSDGDIELQGDIRIDGEFTAKMHISGHDMVAAMHKSRARDASLNFDAAYDKALEVNGPFSIGELELAGGIDLKSISAELVLEDPEHFELKNLTAEVFEGRIEIGSAHYSEGEIAETMVKLSHVSLEKLLAYVDVDGLQGSGYLDISLPVGSDRVGVFVRDGSFGSRGSGRLAYKSGGIVGSNIGLKALENFQFKDLSGTFNYQSDGSYLMNVHLDGNNPDLYDGHAVVFNLKINGALPAAFEAMFMTGSFEDAILKEIKSR
ncbi:MAG: YdbH domain-containing protein, partial [Lysobacterales bacterium]